MPMSTEHNGNYQFLAVRKNLNLRIEPCYNLLSLDQSIKIFTGFSH